MWSQDIDDKKKKEIRWDFEDKWKEIRDSEEREKQKEKDMEELDRKYKKIYRNRIRKLEGINNLENLERVWLENNKIVSIEKLEGLNNLKELYLNKNEIHSISNLRVLDNLKILYAEKNQIKSIQALKELKNLEDLKLAYNQVINAKPIENLSSLQTLGLSYNDVKEIDLSKMENIKRVAIYTNPLRSITVKKAVFLKDKPLDISFHDTFIKLINGREQDIRDESGLTKHYTKGSAEQNGGYTDESAFYESLVNDMEVFNFVE